MFYKFIFGMKTIGQPTLFGEESLIFYLPEGRHIAMPQSSPGVPNSSSITQRFCTGVRAPKYHFST